MLPSSVLVEVLLLPDSRAARTLLALLAKVRKLNGYHLVNVIVILTLL